MGALFSAKGDAYRYLAESIQGFPEPDVLVELFERAGFRDVRYVRLSFGIVAIHLGSK
jgi:ubiquinone/menaquinone biosynthesis C-methylase UbiE